MASSAFTPDGAAFAFSIAHAVSASVMGAGRTPTRPWQIAFNAPAGLPPLRHVLLGMNARINFDLPQALLAVIGAEQFGDAALLACREADHRAIDGVLASPVPVEDDELTRLSGPAPLLDRLLRPLNRLGTQRFLREARTKVWANAIALTVGDRFGRWAVLAVAYYAPGEAPVTAETPVPSPRRSRRW